MQNITEIENSIYQGFPKCEKLENGLLRCERQIANEPWSVVFFDTTGNIPQSKAQLSEYLDKNLASSYFTSSPAELRWNHYLVFVHEFGSGLADLKFIENDQNYARKFLVNRTELPEFLKGYHPIDSHAPSSGDVFGRWAATLDGAGLGAVVDDQARATLVQDFLASDVEPNTEDRTAIADQSNPEDEVYAHFLEELRIRSFLPHPPAGPYPFGSVNLITGPNGVGKTSLLEAIEHFYCGATLRSRLEPIWNADLQAKFKGVLNSVSSTSTAEVFRKRDLRWYGRNYDRKNKLPESFNQYNFYNSDAAYMFVYDENNESLQDALSRLALGDDANRLWDRVLKTLKLFDDEKRILDRQTVEIQTKLMLTTREIEQVRVPSSVIQVLFERLIEHLVKLNWKLIPKSVEEIDVPFLKAFHTVSEAIGSISRLSWIVGPLTILRSREELLAVRDAMEQVRTLQLKVKHRAKVCRCSLSILNIKWNA